MEGLITVYTPFSNPCSQALHGAKQVKSCHSGGEQNLHEDTCSDWCQHATLFLLIGNWPGNPFFMERCGNMFQWLGIPASKVHISIDTGLQEWFHVVDERCDRLCHAWLAFKQLIHVGKPLCSSFLLGIILVPLDGCHSSLWIFATSRKQVSSPNP